MKTFFRDTLFTLGILLIITPFAIYCSSFQKTNSTCAFKYNYVEKHADEIKTLFMGHSHFESGINPWVLDSTYNFAQAARISYYDLELLKHFIPQMSNLKTVIYPLAYEGEPGIFFLSSKKRRTQMFEYKKGMHIEYPPEYNSLLNNVIYYLKGFTLLRNSIRCDTLGYVSLHGVSNNNNLFFVSGKTESLLNNLTEMAKICNQNNIRFIILSCPCNSTFLKENVSNNGIDTLYGIINNIIKCYPVEYHCYLNDTMFADDSLFFDQTHLNYNGATLFTKRLKDDFGL